MTQQLSASDYNSDRTTTEDDYYPIQQKPLTLAAFIFGEIVHTQIAGYMSIHNAFICVTSVLLRALSSFDDLDFGAVKQNLESSQKSVVGISVADTDACADVLARRQWLSAADTLGLARHKLLRAITAVHVDSNSDHAWLVSDFHYI